MTATRYLCETAQPADVKVGDLIATKRGDRLFRVTRVFTGGAGNPIATNGTFTRLLDRPVRRALRDHRGALVEASTVVVMPDA